MSAKLKSADPVATSGLTGNVNITTSKDRERFGATIGSTKKVHANSEDGNQVSSLHSTAHDFCSALNDRDYLDKELLSYSKDSMKNSLSSPLERRPTDDNLDSDYRDRDKGVKTHSEPYDSLSSSSCYSASSTTLPIITVLYKGSDYLLEKGGSQILSSTLSYPEIGELFLLLLNNEAQFVSDFEIKLDMDAIESHMSEYGAILKTPRAGAEPILEYFQRLSIEAFHQPKLLCPSNTIDLAYF